MATTKPKPKKKAVLKTKENDADVGAFIQLIKEEEKRTDCEALIKLFKQVTKETPRMWGASIIGFGNYVYESPATGRRGDWYITGFSPRKQNLTLYIMTGFDPYPALLKKLGKHKTGGCCLYINKLADVDGKVLKDLLADSYRVMKKKHSSKTK
jgi:hypothetical protein